MTECDHVWVSWHLDERKPCSKCGAPGRGTRDKEGRVVSEGNFEIASRARSVLFSTLRSPIQQRDHLADQS